MSSDGIYPPASVSWRVNREAALLLGGGRALLMQLAHPLVARGVDEHSDFRRRPVRRLQRTLSLTLALSFGTRPEALAAARAINLTHQGVRGAGYSARDPELLLWVHATLVDTALVAYTTFVGPLSDGEREAYVRESRTVGELLGIPATAFAADLAAFDAYLELMTRSVLSVDERARALARTVLTPPLRLPSGAGFPLRAVTAGLLPAGLREAYGLPWGRPQRAAFALARDGFRRVGPLVPRPLRNVPQARIAERRIRSSKEIGHGG
jgi:uncharacterized protein (DUF2236 family)